MQNVTVLNDRRVEESQRQFLRLISGEDPRMFVMFKVEGESVARHGEYLGRVNLGRLAVDRHRFLLNEGEVVYAEAQIEWILVEGAE